MRILAGAWRGRALRVSGGVRPTGARTKEALLSAWQPSISECSFLDLFAGCGAVGFEAASRGAREIVFVERNPRAVRSILENREALGAAHCTVVRATLPRLPVAAISSAPFDHVFADPPYDFRSYDELLEQIGEVLRPGGEAAVEHSRRVALAQAVPGLTQARARDYGESRLSFYARPSST